MELGGERVESEGGRPIDAELNGAVEDVEEFGGNVAFPEGLGGKISRKSLSCVGWIGEDEG